MFNNSLNGKFLHVAACLMLLAPELLAQSLTSGDISGNVTDPSSAGVPNAAVTATNKVTGAVQSTTTNSTGFYHFAFLPPGPYQVEIKAKGFGVTQKLTEVQVGQATPVNVQLALASASQTVEVTEASGSVKAENADLTTNVTNQQIANLPNSGNDMTYVALVSAGTVMSTSGGFGNFTTYGIPATSNLFTLNGQNDNDIFFNIGNSGASNLMLGANELSEATVVNNGYSGQYGQLAGANVNYLTKSGQNQFHGNALWMWNGSYLNANDFLNNAAGVPTPFANANQWATSLGGPIWKNHTFFFFDYEGLHNVLPTGVLAKIPSPQFETATIDNLTATGQTAAVALYQKAFALYNGAAGAGSAVPVPGGGCGTGFTVLGAGVPCALQFRATNGNITKEYLWSTRVDHHFSENDQGYIRLWRDNGTQPTFTDPINPIFNDFSPQPQMQGQFGETHTFSPTAVNQFIFSAFYYSARFGPPDENAVLAAFPTTIRFTPALFSNMGGTAFNFPQGRNVQQFQVIDDFSKTWRNHSLKFGMNFRRYDLNDLNFGVLTQGRITELNLTDFFNGGGTGNNLQQRFPTANEQLLQIYQLGGYVQDEWAVNRNLKVTLSLRADHNSNPVCQRDCFARLFVPFNDLNHDPNQPFNAAIAANQQQAFTGVDKVDLQPRFGFAWSPGKNGNTVIRGGFGLFANGLPGDASDAIARNTPSLNSFLVGNGKITPGAPGNLFAIAAGANQSLLTSFGSGATLASIQAANPFFSLPGFTTTDAKFRTPVYQEWNFEIQRALPQKMTFSVNYVGNHGIHEIVPNNNINAFCDQASCGGFGGLPTAAPDARFGIVTQYMNAGVSNYNGVTLSLNRRFAAGLQFAINYTYSHALDDVSNGGLNAYDLLSAPSILNPEDPNNIRAHNYGNADYDVTHYVNANYVWSNALRHLFKGGPNLLFSGWTISGTLYHRTGLPFTVVDSNVFGALAAFNYGGASIFAQQVGPGSMNCGKSAVGTPCFGDSMFTDPTAFSGQTRNQFRGPGYFNTDLSVLKEFALPHWEGARLQIGAQAYNLFNHPNFDKPVNDFAAGPGTFGMIQSTVSPPTSVYGAFVGSAVSGRLLQLKAEFVF
ncbi:MAG: carboxypeptidase regulatory-like domain-containing protein [Acidobacteriia bacterium]|nr:carboxypeptidase regulatory-like domain-containing protein [Terriglobia bacterium]